MLAISRSVFVAIPVCFFLVALLCLTAIVVWHVSFRTDIHDANFVALRRWAETETNYRDVQKGMSKQEGLRLMGPPDRHYPIKDGALEEWSYRFPRGEGHITIQFDGNAVVAKQYGYC